MYVGVISKEKIGVSILYETLHMQFFLSTSNTFQIYKIVQLLYVLFLGRCIESMCTNPNPSYWLIFVLATSPMFSSCFGLLLAGREGCHGHHVLGMVSQLYLGKCIVVSQYCSIIVTYKINNTYENKKKLLVQCSLTIRNSLDGCKA